MSIQFLSTGGAHKHGWAITQKNTSPKGTLKIQHFYYLQTTCQQLTAESYLTNYERSFRLCCLP